MALRPIADEVHAGVGLRVDADSRGVDPFALPQSEELAPEGVVSEPGYVRDLCTLARRGNGGIAGVAAEALQPAALLAGDLRELVHRLAEADEVEHCVRA